MRHARFDYRKVIVVSTTAVVLMVSSLIAPLLLFVQTVQGCRCWGEGLS